MAFPDATKGFCENLLAPGTSKSALEYLQLNSRPTDGLILDFDPSAVMDGIGFRGALRAHFELGFLGTLVMSPELVTLPVS